MWQYVKIMGTAQRAKSTPGNPLALSLLAAREGSPTGIAMLRSTTRTRALTACRIGFRLIGRC